MRLSKGKMNRLIRQEWNQILKEQPGIVFPAGSEVYRGSVNVQDNGRECCSSDGPGRFGRGLWIQVAALFVFGLISLFTLKGYRQSGSALSFTHNELNQMRVQLIPDDFKEMRL